MKYILNFRAPIPQSIFCQINGLLGWCATDCACAFSEFLPMDWATIFRIEGLINCYRFQKYTKSMKHTNGKLQMRFLITFYFDVRHFLLVVIQLKWPVLISVISSHKRNSKTFFLGNYSELGTCLWSSYISKIASILLGKGTIQTEAKDAKNELRAYLKLVS